MKKKKEMAYSDAGASGESVWNWIFYILSLKDELRSMLLAKVLDYQINFNKLHEVYI